MEKSSDLPEGSQLAVGGVLFERRQLLSTAQYLTGTSSWQPGAGRASQVVLVVKNPPAMQETLRGAGSIPGLGIFPWRKTWQPHSSILSWRIPWTKEPEGLQSNGVAKSRTRLKRLSTHAWQSAGACTMPSIQLGTLRLRERSDLPHIIQLAWTSPVLSLCIVLCSSVAPQQVW